MATPEKIVPFSHEYFMKQALIQAQKALNDHEVPVGAVVVLDQKIIGRGYNQVERLQDATAHAEMIALTAAFEHLSSKYLPEASIYVTLEPCLMCSGAIQWSQAKSIVYGAPDQRHGFIENEQKNYFPKTEVISGILETECAQILKDFFKQKR